MNNNIQSFITEYLTLCNKYKLAICYDTGFDYAKEIKELDKPLTPDQFEIWTKEAVEELYK